MSKNLCTKRFPSCKRKHGFHSSLWFGRTEPFSLTAQRLTCCPVHRQLGRCWECRTQRARWKTGLYSWKRPPLQGITKRITPCTWPRVRFIEAGGQRSRTCPLTVASEPLCLVDARRQRREGKHVGVCDPLAHVLLLQIGTLLQIVINSPWEESAELMEQRKGKRGRQKIRLCRAIDRSLD